MKLPLIFKSSRQYLVLSLLLFCIVFTGFSQPLSEKSTRSISFTTDEGTNMSVDVSPDGKTLVFDMLGSLYTVPITGGKAVPLINSTDWLRSPKFSPDGTQIAFISDRGNANNLWVMELKSRKIRQLTNVILQSINDIGVYGTPAWFPDGKKIAYLQWRQDTKGVSIATGQCFDLDKKNNLFSSPVFTPDGKEIISSAESKESGPQNLLRFTLNTSLVTSLKPVESPVTSFKSGWTGDMKPVLSRSGRYLAYLRTTEPSTGELRVRDLKTGIDRKLMSLPDLLRNWTVKVSDGYPGYAITPDEKDIVIWSRGKLFRVSLAGGDARLIPFTVEVKKEVSTPLRAHYHINDDSLLVRSIRWPLVTANKKQLIFSAVGSLWKMDLPNGSPIKITSSKELEIMPALSPNGKELVYICSDPNGPTDTQQRLMEYNMETGKTLSVIAAEDSASYLLPNWSPDGSKIAVVRRSKGWNPLVLDYGWIDISTKQFHRVAAYNFPSIGVQEYVEPMHIVFTQNGEELLYVDRDKNDPYKLILRSVSLSGDNSRDLLTTADPSVTAIYPCPDKKKAIVLGWDYEGYLTEISPGGDSVKRVSLFDLSKKKDLTSISKGGALYPHWSGDHNLIYGWLGSIYQYQDAAKSSHPLGSVTLKVPRRGNQGTYALYNARVITMSGQYGAGRVLENGTIVVRDRRIISVGPVTSTTIPSDAVVIDATGKTIMPGLIDGHVHGIGANFFMPAPDEIRNLISYGFTTVLDAATRVNDDTGLSDIELLEAGKIRGVRCFSTTGMLPSMYYWAPKSGVKYRSYEEVLSQVKRRVELGAEQCLKQKLGDNYRQFSQWMAKAAREAGVSAIAHIQMSPEQALSRAADGYSIDHPGLLAPSYRDVIEFMSSTGSIWTVHHDMGSGSTSRSNYQDEQLEWASMFQRLGPLKEVVSRLSPSVFEQISKIPAEDVALLETSSNANRARLATYITDAGGKIAGASIDGPGDVKNHFQLWEFRRQGMPPGDVLRTATMIPAEKLGIQADAGSIEVGKLADMLILNGNPLERIESTMDIKYCILAGDIYDRETLKVIPPKELAIKK